MAPVYATPHVPILQRIHVAQSDAESTVRRRWQATAEDANHSLSDFLVRRCPEAPVGFLNRLLRQGFVIVDGTPADRRAELNPGQRISLRLPDDAFLVAPNSDVPFRVVHEDESLIIVEKPSGVVSEPGIGHKLDTLLNGLIARYGKTLDRLGPECDFGMVHRLDRDASGLLVIARKAGIQRRLKAEFRRCKVDKRYLALLHGALPRKSGTIRLSLGRKRRRGRAIATIGGPGAKPAMTAYSVLERFPEATLVEAIPHTGRWRQLRLHFAAMGHPIAGDHDHGDDNANERVTNRCGLDRLFLHAAHLAFAHPATGQRLTFSSTLPDELRRVADHLRHAGGHT